MVVVAHVADEGRAPAELSVAAGGKAAGLPHIIPVLAEVGLDAEVDIGAVEIDIGVNADIAHDHDFTVPVRHWFASP